jgi:hypothetical protein
MGLAFGGSAVLVTTSVLLAQNYEMYFGAIPTLLVVLWYNLVWMAPQPCDATPYLKFNNPSVEKKYAKVPPPSDRRSLPKSCPDLSLELQNRIPISHLYEYYIDGDVEFKGDVLVRCLPSSESWILSLFS